MIKSFKSKETEKIFNREYSLKLPFSIQKVALRKLWMINASISLNDLRVPPANHLEKLKSSQSDFYSIRINDQWRICFRWYQNDAYEVNIIDYHK
jgi:proteic killer suppression protein